MGDTSKDHTREEQHKAAAGARPQEKDKDFCYTKKEVRKPTGTGAPRWDGPPPAHSAGLVPVILIIQAKSRQAEHTRMAHDILF